MENRRPFEKFYSDFIQSTASIVEVLTGSLNPRRYWSNLKIQLSDNEGVVELYPKTVQLKLEAADYLKKIISISLPLSLLKLISQWRARVSLQISSRSFLQSLPAVLGGVANFSNF